MKKAAERSSVIKFSNVYNILLHNVLPFRSTLELGMLILGLCELYLINTINIIGP